MTKQEQIEVMYKEFLSYRFDTEIDKFSYKGMCENFISKGYRKESDTAQLAIQRFINQLHIDRIIDFDSDLGKELLKEKEFVLKRYYDKNSGILIKEKYIDLSRYVKEQKEQAVKEFVERVKAHAERCYDWAVAKIVSAEVSNVLDVLLKEYEK